MRDNRPVRLVLASALWFALVGPLVGYVPVFLVIALHEPLALAARIEIILTAFAAGLLAAYIVGAPAAIVVGATRQVLRDRGISGPWIVIINIVLGTTLSALTIYLFDVYVLPHGDPASRFERGWWWLVVALTGGLAAMICTIMSLAGRKP